MTMLTRLGRHGRVLACCLIAVVGLSPRIVAQDRPSLPDEEKYGRASDDYSFRFCVDPRDPGWEFDKAIGQAIAESLLLEPQMHVVADTNERAEFNDLYRHLLADCAIYFGFKLFAGGYPEWVTVTRAYYETGYVFVGKAPTPPTLGDIAPGEVLGVTIGSAADFRLVQFNNARPAEQRWRRFPMSTDLQALEAVLSGEAAAALVWGPSFYALSKTRAEIAALEIIASPAPLSLPPVAIGGVLLSRDTFLRNTIDQAIAALVADGVVDELLTQLSMPGSAPSSP
ncbi:MAG: transporter substrate-binding protein [Devosia sp.]|nr:transporter substrate-binding protein [Devosia sp.]